LVEKKMPPNRSTRVGRPATDEAIVELILQFATENPSWGYDRIVGALKHLGRHISDTTVGNILKQNAQPPTPERKKRRSWADFIAGFTPTPGERRYSFSGGRRISNVNRSTQIEQRRPNVINHL
jgi:hypothetical protein